MRQPVSPRANPHLLRAEAAGEVPRAFHIPGGLRLHVVSQAEDDAGDEPAQQAEFRDLLYKLRVPNQPPGRLLGILMQARLVMQRHAPLQAPGAVESDEMQRMQAELVECLDDTLVSRQVPLFAMKGIAVLELANAVFHMDCHAASAEEPPCTDVAPGTLPLAALCFETLGELRALASDLGSRALVQTISHELLLLDRDCENALELIAQQPLGDVSRDVLDRMELACKRAPAGRDALERVVAELQMRNVSELAQDWQGFEAGVDALPAEDAGVDTLKLLAHAAANLAWCMGRAEQLGVDPPESAAEKSLSLAGTLRSRYSLEEFATQLEGLRRRDLRALATVAGGAHAELIAAELERLDEAGRQLLGRLDAIHHMGPHEAEDAEVLAQRLDNLDVKLKVRGELRALARIDASARAVRDATRLIVANAPDMTTRIVDASHTLRELTAVLAETGRSDIAESSARGRIIWAVQGTDLQGLRHSQLLQLDAALRDLRLDEVVPDDVLRVRNEITASDAEFDTCQQLAAASVLRLVDVADDHLARIHAAFERHAADSVLSRAVQGAIARRFANG